MPGPGAHSREPVAGERLAQAIALGVGHSGVGQNLDQPVSSSSDVEMRRPWARR